MSFVSAEAVDAAIQQLHHTLHKHPDAREPIKLFAQRHISRGEMEAERPQRSAGRVLHHLEDFLKVRARG